MNRKKRNERIHAKKRAKERFNLDLTSKLRRLIVNKIQNRESTLIEIKSNTRTLHKVKVKGEDYIVVYDKKRQEIVTFLPNEDNYESNSSTNS